MKNWTEYTGTDEQIDEIEGSVFRNGYILKYENADYELQVNKDMYFLNFTDKPTHYWIIPYDPLREMKIRQSQTGQPVWVRFPNIHGATIVTTDPDWGFEHAEYSFKPWEE